MKGGAEISFADGTTKNRHRLRGQNGDGFLLTHIMSRRTDRTGLFPFRTSASSRSRSSPLSHIGMGAALSVFALA